ncbi:hypothetical protein C8R46DRAFT_1063451, partial [Mycena filopes]
MAEMLNFPGLRGRLGNYGQVVHSICQSHQLTTSQGIITGTGIYRKSKVEKLGPGRIGVATAPEDRVPGPRSLNVLLDIEFPWREGRCGGRARIPKRTRKGGMHRFWTLEYSTCFSQHGAQPERPPSRALLGVDPRRGVFGLRDEGGFDASHIPGAL